MDIDEHRGGERPRGDALDSLAASDLAEDRDDLSHLLEFLSMAVDSSEVSSDSLIYQTTIVHQIEQLRIRLRDGSDPAELIPPIREVHQWMATLRVAGRWQSPLRPVGTMVYHRQGVPDDAWLRHVGTAAPYHGARWSRVLFFSSFMAAQATVLGAAPPGPILMDTATYFETDALLLNLAKHPVHRVNPRAPGALVGALAEIQPALVLLDLAPNEPDMPLTRLDTILDALRTSAPDKPRWTVIDHSLLGPIWEPLPEPTWPGELLMLGRSLQKLDQCGLDLTAAGILIAYGLDDRTRNSLERVRAGLGSVLPERQRWFLEAPDRDRHRRRRIRAFRNGAWLRVALERNAERWPGISIQHLSQDDRPIWTMPAPRWRFCPPLLFIALPPPVQRVVQDADSLHAAVATPPLPLGASFGFWDTRASFWGTKQVDYLRIDVGLERADRYPDVEQRTMQLLDQLWTAAAQS